jgi:chitin disaccharide deacetylase
LHDGVNRAAVQLAASRRASAIACLVGAPAWQPGSRLLTGLDTQRIDIGLHLDLTEFPLIAASRSSLPALAARAYAGRLNQRLLRAEIAAQLDAFEQALGRAPSFVDGHRHVHQLPGVRAVLLELLDPLDGPSRPWLRRTRQPRGSAAWKPRLIAGLGAAALSRSAADHGFAQNRHLLGVYNFSGGALRYRALLRVWLAAAGDADLLMCHPSLRVQAEDRIAAARAAEYEVLAGPYFALAMAEAGVCVQPMSRILAAATSKRQSTHPAPSPKV